MFGFGYIKASPTTYVIHYVNGNQQRSGAGLSFFYLAYRSQLVFVPLTSVDVPYAFTEMTADFQDVTVQGELTYRVHDPERVANVLDYSVDPRGRYRSDDPTKLSDRIIRPAQELTRAFTQERKLSSLLLNSAELTAHVAEGLRSAELLRMLGVEVLAFNILSLKPTPEMSKAIQADTREELLRKADEAVYARRNAAVLLERQIKENELNTEIAVAEKKRNVRETKMAGDIAVEQQRAQLVDHRVENQRKEADARGYAVKTVVDAIRDADWRTLMATGGADPGTHIAMAFRELAERAEKIGTLNITPELLDSLTQKDGRQFTVGKAGNA
jgi:regulator of protease activity HflC (stomatin/prohibitin superfamily)